MIMESSDSLVSQAASLPPTTCENPEHLPPALPPKRHRTSTKLNNLNAHTPPSSPHFISNDSHEIPTIDVSSHNLNNNNLINNNRNKITIEDVTPAKMDTKPISPSSNYVQISSSTINAAAAAEAAFKPNTEHMIVKPIVGDNVGNKTVNNVQHCNENDVRVIYTNVNNLNSTNNRSPDGGGKSKEIDAQQKLNQSINNNNYNNNMLSDENDDAAVIEDDEDVVILRRPQASPNKSPKVLLNSIFNLTYALFTFKINNQIWFWI